MIGWVFIGLVVFLILIEVYSLGKNTKSLRFRYETDMNLSEPDEIITVRFQLNNITPLPVFYAGLSIHFDGVVKIVEDEAWCEKHLDHSLSGSSVGYNLTLPPFGKYTGKVHIALTKRGFYELGRVYIETGDFLGLKTEVMTLDPSLRLTCTSRMSDDDSVYNDLGGLMGDVSVRRFINDDPTLIVGYREYTGTEPMKMVSWNQTAKMDRLMVRKNDFTADCDIAVLVNMEDAKLKDKERGLEIVRTVCEALEERQIPYSFISNGDLFSVRKGLGKAHLGEILRRIGLSRLAFYSSFADLVDSCVDSRGSMLGNRSYVVVTPELDDEGLAALEKLRRFSDSEVCVIYEDEEVV